MNAQLSEVTIISCLIRTILALVLGGVVGMEREKKGRPAGLRTYMLVCVGASLVMMTNQYMAARYPAIDVSRMAAQVISGIGFLGAGTIIITRKNQVRGLTTAAGLWAVACLGLAIGIGFYYGAIIGAASIFFIMEGLRWLDDRLLVESKEMTVYVELQEEAVISDFMEYLKQEAVMVFDVELVSDLNKSGTRLAGVFLLRMNKKVKHCLIVDWIAKAEQVMFVKEVF